MKVLTLGRKREQNNEIILIDQLVIKEFGLVESEQNNPKMLFLIWLIFSLSLDISLFFMQTEKKKNDWSGTKLKDKQDWPFRRKAECFQIAVELWSQIQKTNWVSSQQEKEIRFFSFVSDSHTLKLKQSPWWWQTKKFQILN